jgi:predicted MFS family arabinose efflux permease
MNWDSISESDRSRIRRWQIGMVALALMCEIFLAADWYAFAAVIPFISKTLQLDPAQAGLAQGIFALTYAIGMIGWSQISLRLSARNMLLIGLAGTGLGMALQVEVQNFGQLIALRLFIGFFDAAIFLGNMKLIFGWIPQERRASVVGLVLAAYSLAITLDFAVGIPVTIAHGWRIFFAVLAVGTLLMAVLDWIFARNDPAQIGFQGFAWQSHEPGIAGSTLRAVFSRKWVLVSGLSISSSVMAIAGTATWVVPAFIAVQKMPVDNAALIGTAMGLSQVVFLVIGGYLSDRLRKTVMVRIGAVLALGTALAFTVSTVYPMGFGGLLVLAAISGLSVFSGGAVFSLLSERYPLALATAAVGYAEIFGITATFVSPWAMGLAIKASGGAFLEAFIVFSALELACVVALFVLAREPAATRVDVKPAAVPL